MIGIKNISVKSGYSYSKYLKDQLKEIEEQAIAQKAYNSNELTAEQATAINQVNLARYTRCSGALADQWGLSGDLSNEKLNTIAKLELGQDPRTSKHVKVKHMTIHTITDKENNEVELTKKDIKNKFYTNKFNEKISFNPKNVKENYQDVRKSAIETTYTLDSSFSYLYQMMTEEQQLKFEIAFMDSADETRKLVLEPLMKSSTGETGKTMSYSFMHKDNRDGLPFIHIHDETSNLIQLADGGIRAIEIPEIKETAFHSKMDSIFKTNFIEKFKELFPEFCIEAYDIENKEITSQMQSVKDWRVAFDEKSLCKIREKSTAKEKIDKQVKIELKDISEIYESKKAIIDEDVYQERTTPEQHKRQLENLNKYFEKESTFINSRKHKADIHSHQKNSKKLESTTDKNNRMNETVLSLDLKLKNIKDAGVTFVNKSDTEILEELTNINPFFTKNELITEFSKSHGKAGAAKAEELLLKLRETKQIIDGGYSTQSTHQEKFTLKSLCDQEVKNLKLMRNQFEQKREIKVHNLLSKISGLERVSNKQLNAEQKEFIHSVFNDKNASIVVGVPGAGKSLAMSFACDIANFNGHRTIGIAPTGKVATAIANDTSASMAMTVDKLNLEIQKGKLQLDKHDILFLDEASMVGTRNWNQLLSNLNGAKIVVIGDPNQIQSVSVGNTLNEFLKDNSIHKEVKYLTEIRRQQNDVAKEIATVTSLKNEYRTGDYAEIKKSGEHIEKAINTMELHGRVKNTFATTSEKITAISADYLSNTNDFKDKLILATTNESISRINESIQGQRLSKNELKGSPLSNGQESFYIGDRVVLKKNKKGEYNNGDFGTIRSIKDGIATIKLDNNKTKEVKIEEDLKIGLAYATSIHKSQGMTINDTLIFGEDSRVNNSELFNVASTRNRNNVYMYTTKTEFDKVVQSFKRTNDKVSLIDLAEKPSLAKEWFENKKQQKKENSTINQEEVKHPVITAPAPLTNEEIREKNAQVLHERLNKATKPKPRPTPNNVKIMGY